jgi:hypothetical protein
MPNDSINGGNTYYLLHETAKQCLITNIPKACRKDEENDLQNKLKDYEDNKYLVLRRGIIEGCKYVIKSLDDENISLYFQNFMETKDNKKDIDITGYLNTLENFLPLREPKDKQKTYKLFIRTLAHEWEAASPKQIVTVSNNIYHEKISPEPIKTKHDAVLAWIMLNTRNWGTHNPNLFSETDERFVAYLFIVNLRTMFEFSDDKPLPYEEILFKLFHNKKEDLKKDSLFEKIKNAYDFMKVLREEKKELEKIRNNFFLAMANDIQWSPQSDTRNKKTLFIQILYQAFWLTICPPNKPSRFNKLKEEKPFSEASYMHELAKCIHYLSFECPENSICERDTKM